MIRRLQFAELTLIKNKNPRVNRGFCFIVIDNRQSIIDDTISMSGI